MAEEKSELQKRNILRASSAEANRISRECLQAALVHLMSQQPFQKITITDLVQRAGVGRATFYRNYDSKEDLLAEIVQAMAEQVGLIFQKPEQYDSAYARYLDLFRKLEECAPLFRILFSSKLSVDRFFSAPSLMEEVRPTNDPQSHYKTLAFEGACLYIIKDWILKDMPQSPDEMAKICSSICLMKFD